MQQFAHFAALRFEALVCAHNTAQQVSVQKCGLWLIETCGRVLTGPYPKNVVAQFQQVRTGHGDMRSEATLHMIPTRNRCAVKAFGLAIHI